MLTALVTENLESTTFLDQVEQIVSGESTEVTKYQRVISYGVALVLDRVAGWLDVHTPDERGATTGQQEPPSVAEIETPSTPPD